MEIHLKYIVMFIGILSMFFASLPRHRFRYGLETAWLIIFAFLAVRYDFGNDYLSYKDIFDDINAFHNFFIDEDEHVEAGWQVLCRIFRPLGFQAMIIFLTAFECYIFYRFIKKNVPERYYWFSIFIFVFNPSLMLIGASMLRNELTITLFVLSIDYIRDRKLIPFLAITLLSMQFHSSAIVLFLFYIFAYIKNIESKQIVYAIIFVVYIVLISATSQLGHIIEDVAMLADEEEALEYYSMNAPMAYVGTGIGTIISYLIFVYVVLTTFRYSPNTRLLFYMLLIGTFVRPFAMILPAIGRYSYYFSIFEIVCYPIIWGGSKEDSVLGKRLFSIFESRRIVDLMMLSLIVLMMLYEYFRFFDNPIWIEKFSEYHTIFELI